MAFAVLSILFAFCIGKYFDAIMYLSGILIVQVNHFAMLEDNTNSTIEHVLVRGVIDRRPFKYEESSHLYSHIWQEIIADINLLVKVKYNNKYYQFGNNEVAKDRFFGIMNKFSRSIQTKNDTSVEDFTYWEKTLLIARNIYEEDSSNEKIYDEKC